MGVVVHRRLCEVDSINSIGPPPRIHIALLISRGSQGEEASMKARSEDRNEWKGLVRVWASSVMVLASILYAILPAAAAEGGRPEAPPKAAAGFDITALALPGAPPDGVMLDYLAADRARHRVWVPAGGTGNIVVIDTNTQEIRRVEKFPTKEVERRGTKRMVGPSSAAVGDGVVYVGNRGDSSVCAVDATTLKRDGCVTLSAMPDGLAFVSSRKERSEEHTSELQSPYDLVCRLLLEKKKELGQSL